MTKNANDGHGDDILDLMSEFDLCAACTVHILQAKAKNVERKIPILQCNILTKRRGKKANQTRLPLRIKQMEIDDN